MQQSQAGARKQKAAVKKSASEDDSKSTSTSEVAIEGVRAPPMLKFSTKGANNYAKFKKYAPDFIMAQFGAAGLCLETGEHFQAERPPVPAADAFTAAKDPHGAEKAVYIKKLQNAATEEAAVKAQWIKVSSTLLSYLSDSSMEAIRSYKPTTFARQKIDSDSDEESSDGEDEAAEAEGPTTELTYANFKLTHDPLMLWRLIEVTHAGSTTGSAVADAVHAYLLHAKLQQGKSETTDSFKERTDNALVTMTAAGLPLPAPILQAALYVNALDVDRYATLQSELANDEAKGLRTRPKNLAEAHNMAMKRMNVVTRHANFEGGTSQQAVFVHNAASPTDPGNGRRGRNGNNKKKEEEESQPDSEEAPVDDSKDQYPCKLCGELGHWISKCPELPRAKAALGKPSASAAKGHKVAVAIASRDRSLDAVVFCADHAPRVKGTQDRVTTTADREGCYPTAVMMDTGATVTIICNHDLLERIRPAAKAITISGITGSISVDRVGDFGPFGEVYYSPDAMANVLAFSDVAKTSTISFQCTAGGSSFTVATKSAIFEFTSRDGLYTRDFAPVPTCAGATPATPLCEPAAGALTEPDLPREAKCQPDPLGSPDRAAQSALQTLDHKQRQTRPAPLIEGDLTAAAGTIPGVTARPVQPAEPFQARVSLSEDEAATDAYTPGTQCQITGVHPEPARGLDGCP